MALLIWSDTISAEARAARDRVEADLTGAGIAGEVLVTGPAGLSGVLTRGDIDLQMRVDQAEFQTVVERLRDLYPPASLHAWAPTLAVFEIPATRPTGLAVTPVGSPHDRRFTVSWERLAGDPGLLAEYNTLKSDHAGTESYEDRKSAFFDRITS